MGRGSFQFIDRVGAFSGALSAASSLDSQTWKSGTKTAWNSRHGGQGCTSSGQTCTGAGMGGKI